MWFSLCFLTSVSLILEFWKQTRPYRAEKYKIYLRTDLHWSSKMPTKGLRYVNKVNLDKDAATEPFLHVSMLATRICHGTDC